MLAGVAMPSRGVEMPELVLLLIDELLDELWSGRGTT